MVDGRIKLRTKNILKKGCPIRKDGGIFISNKNDMKYSGYTIYQEIESVKDDFLMIQDELANCKPVELSDFSIQFGKYLINYNDDGRFEIVEVGYEDEVHMFDVSDLEGAEELAEYFDTNVKPLINK